MQHTCYTSWCPVFCKYSRRDFCVFVSGTDLKVKAMSDSQSGPGVWADAAVCYIFDHCNGHGAIITPFTSQVH